MKSMQVRFMQRGATLAFIAAAALVTTGCLAPAVTPEECPLLNPHTLENKGYLDGKNARDRSNEIVAECAKAGVPIDILPYRKGFELSVQSHYCTAANARQYGEYNRFFNYQECPVEMQASLQESWYHGKEIHQLDQDIAQDTQLKKDLKKSIQDTQSGKEQTRNLYEKTRVLYLLRAEEQEVQERLNYKKVLRERLGRAR